MEKYTLYVTIESDQVPAWFLGKMDFHATILKELVQLRGRTAHSYVKDIRKQNFKEEAFNFKKPVEGILEECEKLSEDFSEHQETEE